jgi:hypothetical protein
MIVVNGENIRLLLVMILGVVWFYLLNEQLRKNNED